MLDELLLDRGKSALKVHHRVVMNKIKYKYLALTLKLSSLYSPSLTTSTRHRLFFSFSKFAYVTLHCSSIHFFPSH